MDYDLLRSVQDLDDLIARFITDDDAEIVQRGRQCYPLRAQLAHTPSFEAMFDRSNMDGHLTASALVVNRAMTKVLMIHHNLFDTVITPGGHCEGAMIVDISVCPTMDAERETFEETGVADLELLLDGVPVDIDTHGIPARPQKGEGEHRHHDLMFAFIADEQDTVIQEAEVRSAQWVAIEDIRDERALRAWNRLRKRIAVL